MQQAEEDAIVLAAQSGNQKAFEAIYRKYKKQTVQYAFKVCGDSQFAEDAVQEAWIKLAKNIRKLEDPRAFRSWLYKTVHWRALDLLRKASHRDRTEEEFNEERYFSEEANLNDEGTLETAGETADKTEVLSQAIKSLPAIERQIVHLFYLDDLKVSEISVVLSIPSGTVKSRLNRARNMLKEKFDSE